MLRPVLPSDTETLIALTADTAVFKPLEIATLREVLGDYHQEDREEGHRAFAWEDDGRVVGIVSQRDLFFNALVRALGFGSTARDRTLDSILVKEVMTEDVVTTAPEAEITTAAQMMVDRKIGCLPVVDADVLVGILSESDIVSAVAQGNL